MSKNILNTSVSQLRGVGDKLEKSLSDLGIESLEDLLFYFPLRYQDRTNITSIRNLVDGSEFLVEGEVKSAGLSMGGRRTLVVRVEDSSGLLTLRFFHFHRGQVSQFKTGRRIQLYGIARKNGAKTEMIHPEYRLEEAEQLLEPSLTPVYPTVSGLGQRTWRKLLKQAVDLLNKYPPQDLLEGITGDTTNLREAINFLHQPPPTADLSLIREGNHPAQIRLAREELIAHQLLIQGLRHRARSHTAPAIASTSPLSEKFLESLPFSPTDAQNRVIKELAADLGTDRPMLRLVQGDVGSGKTLVAALAALDAIASGLQVAFMAPTELLAEQHWGTLNGWFEPLGIPVRWLSGQTRGRSRAKVLESLVKGHTSIVVGTHALFQEDVKFHKLGLIVVDEQHRFGVHQRLSLAMKGSSGQRPHQLALTATPIPRSLAMVAYGDLDFSIIDQLPPGRKPIQTTLIEVNRRDAVINRIGSACAAGRQAYWVCTAIEGDESAEVETAEATLNALRENLTQIKIGLIHGRLKTELKSKIMEQFKNGDLQLLVATTVIEVGVDVPNASLMIIDNPERLGLAQLHQLRGRVGRGQSQSHCLLMFRSPLSDIAQRRLNVMRDTQSGFTIAEEDLRLRGPGELLGTRQTGLVNFRVATIPQHEALLQEARQQASLLARKDPRRAQALINRWTSPNEDFARV